jgi:hypothetical protein
MSNFALTKVHDDFIGLLFSKIPVVVFHFRHYLSSLSLYCCDLIARNIDMIPTVASTKHKTKLLPDVSRVGPSIAPTANIKHRIAIIENTLVITVYSQHIG